MKARLKKILFRLTDIFEENTEFLVIRRSMVSAIPILMIGSISLLLTSLPMDVYQEFINNLAEGRVLSILQVIYNAAFQLFSVVLVISISVHYATMRNSLEEAIAAYPVIALGAYIAVSGTADQGFSLSNWGVSAIFIAIVSTIISCKLLDYLYMKFNYKSKHHTYGVDNAFSSAVKTILPGIIIISIFALAYQILVDGFGYTSFQQLFSSTATKLFDNIGNGIGAAAIFSLSAQILWFFGIHGNNVFEAVAQDNFIRPLEINIANIEKGLEATEIFSKSFYDVFIIMGGCGTILCLLAAIFLVGKRSNTRGIAKMGLLPALFNISELVVFGLPVIFTPIFLIPFLLTPLVLLSISYIATAIGLVPCVSQNVTWTTPIILGGYKATGSYAGSVLQIVNLIIGTLIYIPFVRLYEEKQSINLKERVKKLESELWRKEDLGQKTDFLTRNDIIGSTAQILLSDLKYAIRQKELYLFYQVQVDMNGDCIGSEALLRWSHPLVGNVVPPLIIALAKESGCLPDIEQFLFDETCSKIQQLDEYFNKKLKISVNITSESLFWNELESVIDKCVEKYNIKHEQLWLEITEQDSWINSQTAVDKIQRLKDKGHKMIIDDFGMGHTSLLYLQTNLFDIVKLDGSLTRGIEKNNTNKEIISSIVYLSHSLKFDIIAEYVETKEQKDLLKDLGCTGFQGHLYSKAIPFEQFEKLLEKVDNII